jgi:hypothetical protein
MIIMILDKMWSWILLDHFIFAGLLIWSKIILPPFFQKDQIIFSNLIFDKISLNSSHKSHNVCKTVWLSEALLVYGDMTWTLLAATIDSLDELRKCLKSALLLSRTPRAAGQ